MPLFRIAMLFGVDMDDYREYLSLFLLGVVSAKIAQEGCVSCAFFDGCNVSPDPYFFPVAVLIIDRLCRFFAQ